MKQLVRGILFLLMIIIALTLEWSVLPSLLLDHRIYLFLIVSIALLSLHHDRIAILFALIGALIHELLSPLSFGILLVSYGTALAICKSLLTTKFIEFSFLSLMVVACSTILGFHVALIISDLVGGILSPTSTHLRIWDLETYVQFLQIIWTNLVSLVILVVGTRVVHRVLSPYLRMTS